MTYLSYLDETEGVWRNLFGSRYVWSLLCDWIMNEIFAIWFRFHAVYRIYVYSQFVIWILLRAWRVWPRHFADFNTNSVLCVAIKTKSFTRILCKRFYEYFWNSRLQFWLCLAQFVAKVFGTNLKNDQLLLFVLQEK